MTIENQPVRVLISAPYPSVRAGLRVILDAAPNLTVIGEFANVAETAEVDLGAADVLVAEVHDEEALQQLASTAGATAIVFLASQPEIFRAVADRTPLPGGQLLQGATGDEIVAAVTAVAAGLVVTDPAVAARAHEVSAGELSEAINKAETPLTAREQEVLALVAAGLPNKAIALRLGISDHTVKFHVGAILGKLGAASRTEAVTVAVRGGMLPL